MSRARSLLLAVPLLAACGPSPSHTAGVVLFAAPLVYGLAALLVSPLFTLWSTVRPELNFGRNSHLIAVALTLALAAYGATTADINLIGLAVIIEGPALLGLWLLLARLTLRSGWGFRWGGLLFTVVFTAPMLLALLVDGELRRLLVDAATLTYFYVGGLGLVPLLIFLVTTIEAVRAGTRRPARTLVSGDEPPP